MTGTSTWARIAGAAAAAASLYTVARTSSLPAGCSARTCAAVAAGSAVSVLVIDWTTIGWAPPTFTPTTSTTAACRRWRGVTRAIYEGGAAAPAARSPLLAQQLGLHHHGGQQGRDSQVPRKWAGARVRCRNGRARPQPVSVGEP